MERSKIKISHLLVIIIFVIIVIVWGLITICDTCMSDDEFCEFMYGQNGVELISLKIYYQQREVYCVNRQSLKCITNAIKKSQPKFDCDGARWHTYKIHFNFNNGKFYSCRARITKDRFTLSIPKYDLCGEQLSTHLCILESPPKKVRKMFEYLCLPIEKLKSHVLIIE